MGYSGYYVAWLAVSYLIREPWLLCGLGVLWLVRGLLPPPGALFGALSRARPLREQVRLNRANITARRDLATLYLELLQPRRALRLLEEGLALAADDPELLYLYGLALHGAGRHAEALPRLLSALERDPRLRHGRPYFVAGETLLALRRWDDAADAFERYLDFSSSDVAAHTQLSRAHAGAGDTAAARKWLLAGLHGWRGLPGVMKRRQLGAYLKAQAARASVLKEPVAVVVAVLLGAACVAGAVAAYPLLAGLWRPAAGLAFRAREAEKLCGSQRTGAFEGRYRVVVEAEQADDESAHVVIERDRIVMGNLEYCLSRVLERKPQSLHAEAIVRVHAPPAGYDRARLKIDSDELAGMLLNDVRLDRGSELVRLRIATAARPLSATSISLRRQP